MRLTSRSVTLLLVATVHCGRIQGLDSLDAGPRECDPAADMVELGPLDLPTLDAGTNIEAVTMTGDERRAFIYVENASTHSWNMYEAARQDVRSAFRMIAPISNSLVTAGGGLGAPDFSGLQYIYPVMLPPPKSTELHGLIRPSVDATFVDQAYPLPGFPAESADGAYAPQFVPKEGPPVLYYMSLRALRRRAWAGSAWGPEQAVGTFDNHCFLISADERELYTCPIQLTGPPFYIGRLTRKSPEDKFVLPKALVQLGPVSLLVGISSNGCRIYYGKNDTTSRSLRLFVASKGGAPIP